MSRPLGSGRKLTEAQEAQIRRYYAQGFVTYKELGKRFNVSRAVIYLALCPGMRTSCLDNLRAKRQKQNSPASDAQPG